MQCGLTPQQVLDINLLTFRACVDGYQEHMFDLKCIAVTQGFWAGYYSKAKRPKPLSTILQDLLKSHSRSKQSKEVRKPNVAVDVDVEAFLEQERRFKEKLKASEGR